MWRLFGICVIVLTTKSAGTNGVKNEYYLGTNWERFEGNKSPNICKRPTKLLFLSTPYNSSMTHDKWNKILRVENNRNINDLEMGNKIIENDEETKYQMVQLRSSGSPGIAEWLFARNNNNEKGHRNPSFSPWGGKRNSIPYKIEPKIRRPSRVPFNSWGGKRDRENDNLNEKINNDNNQRLSPINLPETKKPFNSWGGKRTPTVVEYLIHLPSNELLKNILQSARLTSVNEHFKHDFLKENNNNNNNNNGASGVEEKEMRITFEPWSGKKINVDSSKNDFLVSSAPTLHYTQ